MRVLIFEDDPDNRKLFSDISIIIGFEAVAFSDPSEIGDIGSFGFDRTDIVLTDIAMPVMSGIKFAERIIRSGFDRLNIAIISGFWDEENRSDACRLGVRTFAKPVSVEMLADWLKRRRDEQKRAVL